MTATLEAIDDRIAARRAELLAARQAIPPLSARPLSMTREESEALDAAAARRDRQLAELNAAVAAHVGVGSAACDEQWLAHLTQWRKALCDERMHIKSPIRDPKVKGRERNLALSIKALDRGLHVFKDTGWELENSRLGELMRASGYVEVVPPEPARNFGGQLPWFGSMPEVEQRIAALAHKRAQAEAALEDALLSDAARAQQEAESKQLRDAFNAMTVKIGADADCLVAYRNGEPYPVDEMTPLQRKAFEAADEAFRAGQARPREASVAS